MLDRTILLPVMLFAGVCCCGVSAGVPADVSVRNGLYQDVPAPRGKNKKVYRADPLTGWLTFPVSYSPVRMDLTDEKPLNGANTYSLEVEVTPDIADYGEAAIVNKGYFGMNLKKGTGYRLCTGNFLSAIYYRV